MKRIYTIIAILILLLVGFVKLNYDSVYNYNISHNSIKCVYFKKNSKSFCRTNKIRYYNTDIKFNKDIILERKNKRLDLNKLDVDSLKYINRKVYERAIINTYFILNNEKRELAKIILKYQNSKCKSDKNILLENISKTPQVIKFVNASDRVWRVKNNSSVKLLKNRNIKYAAIYNGEIINYYSGNGCLAAREYRINGKPRRYQVFDKHNNWYTYNENGNLIEYRKNSEVYNSQNELLYVTKVKRDKPRFQNEISYSKKQRQIFLKKLNDSNSNLYKSITTVIDEHYDHGSESKMINALNKYFSNLKVSDPDLYESLKKIIMSGNFTLNFGKYRNRYIFAINSADSLNYEEITYSMVSTLNLFHGKCAEVNLKALAGNKLFEKYFYDIKIQVNDDVIVASVNPPCDACSQNVSLWGWKYPYK